jgi:RNA polymerase sigma factor (sigma-70 family)
MPLTEAEQNRLIIENVALVEKIAANYRGRRGIPFGDLVSAGTVGLVEAARKFVPGYGAQFSTWVTHRIRGAILNSIDEWEELERLGNSQDDHERVYEWQIWGILPSEGWRTLAASPEEITEGYQELGGRQEALAAAMLSLTPRQRRIIDARFGRGVALEQIARDMRMSYHAVNMAAFRAVQKLRDTVRRILDNQIAALPPPRAAAPRPQMARPTGAIMGNRAK